MSCHGRHVSYLCAVECHAGKHGLRDAGSLELVADLLVDVHGDVRRARVPGQVVRQAPDADASYDSAAATNPAAANPAADLDGALGDGRVVEKLVIEHLGMLVLVVTQQAAHHQLLPHHAAQCQQVRGVRADARALRLQGGMQEGHHLVVAGLQQPRINATSSSSSPSPPPPWEIRSSWPGVMRGKRMWRIRA